MTGRAALSLNAGSSSVKFRLDAIETGTTRRIASGEIEKLGEAPHFFAHDTAGGKLAERNWDDDTAPGYDALIGFLLDWIDKHLGGARLAVVGHRVVHGGAEFQRPVRMTKAVLAALDALTPLAPLHQGHNLAPIRAINTARPGLPQVACFDTAFHHTQPLVATQLALPRRLTSHGVRRYGFHGLSYEYIAGELRQVAPRLAAGRVIVAHLGNGASLCALHDGRSIDTTMGFTALDGLVMGTRCGTLDPGVVIYLQRQYELSATEVEHILYAESGLLGVSGISADMRELLASGAQAAHEAVDLFVYRIAREAGALAASLGGVDGFVFTAGIGEHAAAIRKAVCARLAWLGVVLDEPANKDAAAVISAPSSRVEVRVMPTDEAAMILRHALAVVNEGAG